MPFPPPSEHELKIFDSLPTADETTFNSGVLGACTQQDEVSIILFSPNLQIIASLDNTASEVTSNYETSVTHGFTFSTTQSVTVSVEAGVSIEVVSAKVTTTFALSFTEQWNESTTKSMTFSCPPGKSAFVYQGTLMSRILYFDAADAQYKWNGVAAKALTQVLVTSNTPIGIAPSNPVTIGS
jgi:hypothetical protein